MHLHTTKSESQHLLFNSTYQINTSLNNQGSSSSTAQQIVNIESSANQRNGVNHRSVDSHIFDSGLRSIYKNGVITWEEPTYHLSNDRSVNSASLIGNIEKANNEYYPASLKDIMNHTFLLHSIDGKKVDMTDGHYIKFTNSTNQTEHGGCTIHGKHVNYFSEHSILHDGLLINQHGYIGTATQMGSDPESMNIEKIILQALGNGAEVNFNGQTLVIKGKHNILTYTLAPGLCK